MHVLRVNCSKVAREGLSTQMLVGDGAELSRHRREEFNGAVAVFFAEVNRDFTCQSGGKSHATPPVRDIPPPCKQSVDP